MLAPPQIARPHRWVRLVVRLVVVATAIAAAVVWRAELGAWIAGERAAPPADDGVALYTCSMDPSVESPHPGSCPICGMALTPVSREDRASGVVRIGAQTRQQIGVEVVTVASRPLRTRAVASGRVVAPPKTGGGVAAKPAHAAAPVATAWVVAEVYRGDPGALPAGQRVSVFALDLPITAFTGRVAAQRPGDPPGSLQVEVDNPDDALRPGMRAEVVIDLDLPPRLVIPAEAVIVAGERRIVFVELAADRFAPRTPRLGAQAAGFVEVLEGLAEGERVVVHGTFLLAAENRIRSDGALWTEHKQPPVRPPRPVSPRPMSPGSPGGS